MGQSASQAGPSLQGICWPAAVARPVGCCLFTNPSPHVPDLDTYSQAEQLATGAVPTWDSPDIDSNAWRPFKLLPTARVRIRNLSGLTGAINAQVTFSTSALTVGLGLQRVTRGIQVVSLAPAGQLELTFDLPAIDHPLGLFVDIAHPYDPRLINNHGARQVFELSTRSEGRSIPLLIPVVNQSSNPTSISVVALPTDLNVSITWPSSFGGSFAPLEQVDPTITIGVPTYLHGTSTSPSRHDVSLVARRSDGSLVDGITFVVWVDD